jgi:hypothetical protein
MDDTNPLADSLVRCFMDCQLGCGFAALGTLCLCGEYFFTENPEQQKVLSGLNGKGSTVAFGTEGRCLSR